MINPFKLALKGLVIVKRIEPNDRHRHHSNNNKKRTAPLTLASPLVAASVQWRRSSFSFVSFSQLVSIEGIRSQRKPNQTTISIGRSVTSPSVAIGRWRRPMATLLFFFVIFFFLRVPFVSSPLLSFFLSSFFFFFAFFLFLFPPFPASCFAEQVALATAPPDADDLSPRRRRQQVGLTKLFFSFKQKKTTLSTTKRSGKKKARKIVNEPEKKPVGGGCCCGSSHHSFSLTFLYFFLVFCVFFLHFQPSDDPFYGRLFFFCFFFWCQQMNEQSARPMTSSIEQTKQQRISLYGTRTAVDSFIDSPGIRRQKQKQNNRSGIVV